MCLAQVYMKKEGEPFSRDDVLSDVAWIKVQTDTLVLRDLLGQEKVMKGKIAAIDFTSGVVTITMPDQ